MKTSKILKNFGILIAALVGVIFLYGQPVSATSSTDVNTISTASLEDKTGLRKFDLPAPEVTRDNVYQGNKKRAAAYNSPWDIYASKYYYNQLEPNEKKFYDALDAMCLSYLTGTKNFNYQSTRGFYYTDFVPFTGLSEDQAKAVLQVFYFSNPQYYFLILPVNPIPYYPYNNYVFMGVLDEFGLGSKRSNYTNDFANKINAWNAQINPSESKVKKEKQIHDLIVSSVTYDKKDMLNPYYQSAYSTFFMEKTVCAGYAQAFQLLCNAQGIDCTVVTSETHAWNKVRINDSWYVVDCTWDDLSDDENPNPNPACMYLYFNISDNEVLNKYDQESAHVEESVWNGISAECIIDTKSGIKNIYLTPGVPHTPSPTQIAAAPDITPVNNDGSTTVTLTSGTRGARIYYTLDGSDPSEAFSKAQRYKEPFTIYTTQTVKAIAVSTYYTDSSVSPAQVPVARFYAYAPALTAQPSSFSCYYGSTDHKIGVGVATIGMSQLSYQWYVSSSNAYNGTAIPGATAPTYTPSSTKMGTYYYYCIVTNTDNAATKIQSASMKSAIAKITVKKTPISKVSVKGLKDMTYIGKSISPKIKFTYGSLTLKKGKDYTISLSNNKAIGTANIILTGKGKFTGKKTVTFKIIPKGTAFSSKSIGKKRVTLRWKRNSAVNGYQVQYATNAKFKSAKTKKIGSNSTTSLTLSNLNNKKYCYIRIRTFKKVSGKTYSSNWSKPIKVKVK